MDVLFSIDLIHILLKIMPIKEWSFVNMLYVTGSEKTLLMGFFVKIEFDVYLISSTLELIHLQVLD